MPLRRIVETPEAWAELTGERGSVVIETAPPKRQAKRWGMVMETSPLDRLPPEERDDG